MAPPTYPRKNLWYANRIIVNISTVNQTAYLFH